MVRLRAGGGPLGGSLVDLEDLKRSTCKIETAGHLTKNWQMLGLLREDGVYVDDPEVSQKFSDVNVQKLEERLLLNGQAEFFKLNGELRLDNDLMDDELTRPADLAFEQTKAF